MQRPGKKKLKNVLKDMEKNRGGGTDLLRKNQDHVDRSRVKIRLKTNTI